MLSYRVDVSSILDDLGATEVVQGTFALTQLTVGDAAFTLLEPPAFVVNLTNTGTGLVADGTIKAHADTECSRCLERFETFIEGAVEAFYVPHAHEYAIPDDQETEPILPDGTVDLAPALVAALTLEAPFAPIHDESCEGLCPHCGRNLNIERCSCTTEVDEAHPFAVLKDLLEDTPDAR